jgi:hypothetical protein
VRSVWLDRHTNRAPEPLRERVQRHLSGPATAASAETTPGALAAAGRRALEQVLVHPGDRTVALDLLAADALVTLALLAQAQRDPGRLADFAAGILRAGAPHA